MSAQRLVMGKGACVDPSGQGFHQGVSTLKYSLEQVAPAPGQSVRKAAINLPVDFDADGTLRLNWLSLNSTLWCRKQACSSACVCMLLCVAMLTNLPLPWFLQV